MLHISKNQGHIGRLLLVPSFLTMLSLESLTAKAQSTELFTHYLHAMPIAYGTCESVTQQIKAQFSAVTKVPVISTNCHAHGATMQIEIVYTADTRIDIASTLDYRNWPSNIGPGYFDSYQECEAHRAADVDQYTKETGAKVIAAYCINGAGGASHSNPWLVRIDSTRPSTRSYQTFNFAVGYGPVIPEDFISELQMNLAKIPGVSPYRSALQQEVDGYTRLFTGYYAAQRLNLQETGGFEYRSKNNCLDEKNAVDTAYEALGAMRLASTCARSPSSIVLYSVQFIPAESYIERVDTRVRYKDYLSCAADRNRLSQELRSLGWTLGNVICVQEPRQVVAEAIRSIRR